MTVIIDRLEGNTAVAELPGGTFAGIPLCLVPGVREGDAVTIRIDHEKTQEREKRIETLMEQVFRDRP